MSRKSKAAQFVEDVWDIQITGRNVSVTEAMKNYAMDKIAKIERFSNRVIDVKVTMDVQRGDQYIDIILKVDNTKIKASGHSNDMYASIDKAVDRLKEQIRRYKEKINNHHSISHADVAMNVNIYHPTDDLAEFNEEIQAETDRRMVDRYSPRKIVKTETRYLKTLRVDEALVKIQLSGDKFMVFRSEEDKKIKIIYLRDDGNFGIIEPEK
jgi:putative sigma-54 modulation protein